MARALLSLILAVLVGSTGAAEPGWKAGVARRVITPEEPLWMAGYGGRNRPAEGVVHDLWIKVLSLEAGAGRAVLVTADVCGFSRVAIDEICARLKEQCGLERSQVMITCSHTHSGPVLRECLADYYPLDDSGRAAVDRYSRRVEQAMVAAVAEALAALSPATLAAGEAKATFAVNRRNNKEAEVAGRLARGESLEGPVDHSVPVLVVRSPEGRPLAIVFGYACHTTTLNTYLWCGDYAGFAQLDVEREHGGAQAMFFAGCGADQNPLPRRSLELCEKYGRMLASAVGEAISRPMQQVEPQLQTAFSTVELDFEKHPSREELEAAVGGKAIRSRWAQRMLAILDAGTTFDRSYPYPIQVWKLGSQRLWFALGGEVVVDYALRLKVDYGPETWVTAYAHELVAYMPSRRVWEEGGYEGGALYEYMLPADRWSGDVEERILGGLADLVKSLDGAR